MGTHIQVWNVYIIYTYIVYRLHMYVNLHVISDTQKRLRLGWDGNCHSLSICYGKQHDMYIGQLLTINLMICMLILSDTATKVEKNGLSKVMHLKGRLNRKVVAPKLLFPDATLSPISSCLHCAIQHHILHRLLIYLLCFTLIMQYT